MKDYCRVAKKVGKLGTFSKVAQYGYPNEYHPVDLYFQICEAYVIGYGFYVSYSLGEWEIDYGKVHQPRYQMRSIRGIKTEREMLERLDAVLWEIRGWCGVKKPSEEETA